jgi:hypothetical protein
MSQQIISFYVTVGFFALGSQPNILANKVEVRIDPDTETLVQRAKNVRKEFADDAKQKPSQLYYEIYTERASAYPYACSANSPAMNSAA